MAFRSGRILVEALEAGILSETESGYRFSYSEKYLGIADALPVSLTLPLRPEPYVSHVLFPFFDGLIPEGWLLAVAEKTWKLDSRDRMGLVLACCRECIGNVSVLPMAAGEEA
jgi:serine/threonine-protein kinase HipA